MSNKVWVDIFRVGATVYHPRGDVEVTQSFAQDILRNFDALRIRNYAVTVLREHGTVDSYVYGEVHALRINEQYVQASVEFYDEKDRRAYNKGMLREFSPGFGLSWKDPHTGEEMSNVLLEVSFTSMAYQRNLRPPQETNPGVTLHGDMPLVLAFEGDIATTTEAVQAETSTTENPMEEEELEEAAEEVAEEMEDEEDTEEFNAKEAYGSMQERMSAMEARMEEYMGDKEEKMAASAEESSDDEVTRMSKRIAQLEDDNTRLELSKAGIDGEVAEQLVELRQVNPTLYAKQRDVIVSLSERKSTVQSEIGSTGSADVTGGTVNLSSVAAGAAKAGALGHGKLSMYLAANHPDMLGREEEVRAAASK